MAGEQQPARVLASPVHFLFSLATRVLASPVHRLFSRAHFLLAHACARLTCALSPVCSPHPCTVSSPAHFLLAHVCARLTRALSLCPRVCSPHPCTVSSPAHFLLARLFSRALSPCPRVCSPHPRSVSLLALTVVNLASRTASQALRQQNPRFAEQREGRPAQQVCAGPGRWAGSRATVLALAHSGACVFPHSQGRVRVLGRAGAQPGRCSSRVGVQDRTHIRRSGGCKKKEKQKWRSPSVVLSFVFLPFSDAAGAAQSFMRQYFGIQQRESLKCAEAPEEAAAVSTTDHFQLSCHIDKGGGALV